MKVPEIERDLKNHVDPRVIYHLQRMQEELTVVQESIKEAAKIITSLVEALHKLQLVNIELNRKWKERLNPSEKDIVSSVLNKPEDIN